MPPASEPDVLEELASLPTVAHQTVSPDGDEVAFYYDDTGRNEIHVVDVATGERTQWSDGEVPRDTRWFLAWGADGDRIYFHRDQDGDEQNDVYAIDRDGAVEALVETDGQTIIHDVTSDGETLFGGSNHKGQMNVYRYGLASGETQKVTDYDRAIWYSLLSPDGERLAYATNETDDYENQDVYVAGSDGLDARNLRVGDIGAEASPAGWGPDGRRLLFTDNSTDLGRVGVYDLTEDAVTWYDDEQFEEGAVAFLDDERVLAARSRDAVTVPVVYDLATGSARELDVPDGVASFGWPCEELALADGRIVFRHTTPTTRPELLAYDPATDASEPLLEAEHGPFDPSDFADATYLTVDSDGVPETPARAVAHDPYDELEIGALLYDPGERPAPLVVNPHGGPRYRDEKRFDVYTQVLGASGYAVLQVNFRGSTGRGREFVERLYGDWGGAEQGDVATAAEHVLAEYDWLDDDRVAVFGGSFGGYSAYWQLLQYPALYDAGIAWIGVTDLLEMFETTTPQHRTELMVKNLGRPDDHPDRYAERSPVNYVENLDSPLLIVHGVNDSRVPVSQARVFRDALDDAGYEQGEDGDFEYRELGEEGHASSDQQQKLRLFRLLDDFLARRLDDCAGD